MSTDNTTGKAKPQDPMTSNDGEEPNENPAEVSTVSKTIRYSVNHLDCITIYTIKKQLKVHFLHYN